MTRSGPANRSRTTSAASLLVGATLAALCMAPTVGDIGGCGTTAEAIAPERYESARKQLDCSRCSQCSIATARCQRACDPAQASDIVLPATCKPLVHDAEVCLRALLAKSCDDFAKTVADTSPETPSECLFCKDGNASDAAPGFIDDGGGAP